MVTTPAFFNPMSSGGATSWADDEMDTTHFMPPTRSTEPSMKKEEPVEDKQPVVTDNQQPEAYEVRAPSREAPNVAPFTGYIGNLPYEMTEGDVTELFGNMSIANIRMPMDFRNNRRKGFAYVEFNDRESLVKALELNGKIVDSRHIRVDVAAERKPRERRNSMERRTKSGGRSWEPEGNKGVESNDAAAPKERKRISLLPRTKSIEERKEEQAARNRAIFGGAKPRDESEYRQRKMSTEEQAVPVAVVGNNATEKEKTPEKKPHYSKSGGRPRTKSIDGQQQPRERLTSNPRQRTKAHKFNRRKLSDEEIIKKATVTAKKATTKVENPFSALLSDTDSEDSE